MTDSDVTLVEEAAVTVGAAGGSHAQPAGGEFALVLQDIEVAYGRINAVTGVSTTVAPGQCLAILGPNGAGKSSLLRAISGVVRPKAGTVRLLGQDVTGQSAHKIARQGLSFVQEGRGIFPRLTVDENLRIVTAQLGDDLVDTIFEYFPRLRERRRQLAGTMSGGEQQMLALSLALLMQPRVLLVDEPSLGLAPVIVQEIFDVFREIRTSGTTLVVVEQFVHMAIGIADHVHVMQKGTLVASGDVSMFEGEKGAEILGAYLGQAGGGGSNEAPSGATPPPPVEAYESVGLEVPTKYLRWLEREAEERGVTVESMIAAKVEEMQGARSGSEGGGGKAAGSRKNGRAKRTDSAARAESGDAREGRRRSVPLQAERPRAGE